MLKATVLSNNRLTVEETPVGNSVEFEEIVFSFPESWRTLVKTVLFSPPGETSLAVMLEPRNGLCTGMNSCYIPHEVLEHEYFYLSVFGVSENRRATTTREMVTVARSGYTESTEPEPPTPDEYSQIVSIMEATREIAQGVRDDADSGKFLGIKGEKGDTGEAGIYYGEDEPISDTHPVWINPKGALSPIVDTFYPVGSIYFTMNGTNPSQLFGGAWEQIKDTFLLSAGDKYALGATGGEAQHILTVGEMPAHTHSANKTGIATRTQDGYGVASLAQYYNTDTNPFTTNVSGGGKAHNNMPPYLAVYVWKRIA